MPSRRSRSQSRPRSRSTNGVKKRGARSQSRDKSVKIKDTKGILKQNKPNYNAVRKIITSMHPIVRQLNDAKKKMLLHKEGYFTDNKDQKFDPLAQSKTIELLQQELKMALQAVRAGLGDRPIRMRLTNSFVITTTVTTGVTNTVTITGASGGGIGPSNATEWASCAALFDEYKMFGGHCDFVYVNPIPGGTAANQTSNALPVIGYETDGATLPTSSLLMTQLAQHKVLTPIITTAANVYQVPAMGAHHNFKFHVPKGTAIGGSDGLNVDPGTEWIVVSNPVFGGYLKFYYVGNGVTANDTGAGIIYYDVEFRCRV